ncbi:MAG TPA: hypothetical protein G4O15_15420 [Dehalococcoidia bacterium]|nr:hypothetical protein [Dehalococcoidia bacterium]
MPNPMKKLKGLPLLKKLFKRKKTYRTNKERYPDDYYAAVYISKELDKAVKIVAEIEKISKKAAVDRLLHLALKRYFGMVLYNHKRDQLANQWIKLTTPKIPISRGMKVLRKHAIKSGISLYRLIKLKF